MCKKTGIFWGTVCQCMSKPIQRHVEHVVIPNIPDIPVLYCEEARGDHFNPTGIISPSCHSNWPGNPNWFRFGHFTLIKPKRLKEDLLGLLGWKIPCSLARAPRLLLSILFCKEWNTLRTLEVLQPFCHHEGWCQE